MIKKTVLLTLLISMFSIYAELPKLEDVTKNLTADNREILISEGELSLFHNEKFIPEIIPNSSLTTRIMDSYREKDINLGTEFMVLYRDLDLEDLENSTEDYLLNYYNTLANLSSLQGINYWSNSRQKYRLLFEESWFIDSPEDMNRVDDPIFTVLNGETSYFIHQKDKTFGDSESKVTYKAADDALNMTIVNETPLKITVIKAVDKKNLTIDMLIVPTDKGLLCYGLISAKTIKFKLLEERASNSFYYRIVAINNWFTESIQ